MSTPEPAADFSPSTPREWDMVRAALLAETGWCCAYCQVPLTWKASTIDHQIPRCCGGTDHFANLAIACTPCNSSKGGRNVWQWRDPDDYRRSALEVVDGR
jgi:5-methylcytosine-specific restriction endonuclease McrA